MPKKLTPSLSEKFESAIWKIETDEQQDVIAIETRDPATKTVAYSAYNYRTGQCYFREKSFENSWWSGLDRVFNGMIYLVGYPTENSPGRKGLLTLEIKSGRLCWQQYQFALEGIAKEGLLVYNTSILPKKIRLLSAETGEIQAQMPDSVDFITSSVSYPLLCEDPLLLPAYLPENIAGPVFHTSINGKQCWCFHTKVDGIVNQTLLIAKNDDILLLDYLDQAIQKLNPEAFFIQNDFLFCIRNRSEIVSYLV